MTERLRSKRPPTSSKRAEASGSPSTEPARRPDWVNTRERILEASSTLFAQKGYRRVSTSDLAKAAGVAEATLFRHFPAKAQLFEHAVISPLRVAVSELAERRRSSPSDLDTTDAAYLFFDEIIGFLRQDAGLLVAALAALTFEGDRAEFTGVRGAFDDLLEYMDDIIGAAAVKRSFTTDPILGGRIMLAMALGSIIGDQLLFDDENRPTHQQLATGLAEFTAHGITGRPPRNTA